MENKLATIVNLGRYRLTVSASDNEKLIIAEGADVKWERTVDKFPPIILDLIHKRKRDIATKIYALRVSISDLEREEQDLDLAAAYVERPTSAPAKSKLAQRIDSRRERNVLRAAHGDAAMANTINELLYGNGD